MNDLILDDSTPNDVWFDPHYGRGAVPRDYSADPPELFQPPSQMPLIPRSEWDARIDEQEREQSSLEHIRLRGNGGRMIPSLDQGSEGFCWIYSVAGTVMIQRARANQPGVRLSPHAGGCKIKNFRNEGAWCGLAAKFLRENGLPDETFWPQKSMDRSHDNPRTWANAAEHKITEDWVDLTRQVWENRLTFDQVATALLLNNPCALDFNHWSHSVLGLRLVRVEAGSYGIKILNSWTDDWGDRGMAVLRGSKAIPDGAICTRSTTVS